MSRHRTAYTEEDLYDDYDDYYEEEEEEYDHQSAPSASTHTASFFDVAPSSHSAHSGTGQHSSGHSRDEQILFILDMLGSESVVTGTRVGQLLDLYGGDSEHTI